MQKEADKQMSGAWLLVYILPIIVGIIAFVYFAGSMLEYIAELDTSYPPNSYSSYGLPAEFAAVWTGVAAVSLIGFAVNIVLTYMLVNRRSTHFKRQKFLSEDLVAAVNSLAKTKNVDVESGLSSIERTVREANIEEIRKDAVPWAILAAFIPFMQWYVYYFLMKDFYRHERREDGFWEDLSRMLDKLGVNFSVPRRTEAMPDRSFVLYLILTIITAGLFGVYWVYVLIKDPNEHFNYHIQTERQLLTALESVASAP